MSKDSILSESQTDWDGLQAMRDEDIDLSDIPEISEEQLDEAVIRFDRQPIPNDKVAVSMLLDADVVEYFRARAGQQDFRVLINAVLKAVSRGDKATSALSESQGRA